jgi:DNA-damage-inducible protein D
MSDDSFRKPVDKVNARDALARIRDMLKGNVSPLSPLSGEENTPSLPLKSKEIFSGSYSGTVEDLIETIESAASHDSNRGEFWSARTLMEILGYKDTAWDDFKEVILKAQYACERSDQRINAHFSKVVGAPLIEKNDDIKVTRYGAYLIAQNGDTRNKQVAYAQTYFATQARRQQLQETQRSGTKDEQQRLAMRERITEHNKVLADAAREAGVEAPLDFARFQNFGYEGLYNGLDVNGIRKAKKLSEKAKILDHMDLTELAANYFRATQAEDKLRRDKIVGKKEANAAHHEVGRKVRKAIKDIGGTMPEKLPAAENIDDVRKRIAKLEDKTLLGDAPSIKGRGQ